MTNLDTLPTAQRDAFVTRLAAASTAYGATLKANPVQVRVLPPVPLYPGVSFFQVQADLRHRPMILLVAEVRQTLVLLGTPDGVAELNRLIGITLASAEQVADYLRFWFRASGHRTQTLVESAADFTWLAESPDDPERPARRDRASRLAHHIAVGHPVGGAYPAEATVVDQRTLQMVRFSARPDGHVTEIDRVVLMEQVPVPYVML